MLKNVVCFMEWSKHIYKQKKYFLNILIWVLGHDSRGSYIRNCYLRGQNINGNLKQGRTL